MVSNQHNFLKLFRSCCVFSPFYFFCVGFALHFFFFCAMQGMEFGFLLYLSSGYHLLFRDFECL